MNWFFSLKGDHDGALFNNVELTDDTLIISNQVAYNNKYVRKFAAFDNIDSFIEWYVSIESDKRTYFETIMGEKPQKIYFDIDVKPDKLCVEECEKLIMILKQEILNEVNAFNVKVDQKDILVFSSVRTKNDDKISYHIVVNNYYVANHKVNKEICSRIRNRIDEDKREFIDVLYSSLQQFRLVFSHKSDYPDRIKKICKNLTDDTNFDVVKLIKISLVSYVKNCKLIEAFYDTYISEKKIAGVRNLTPGSSGNFTSNIELSKKNIKKLAELVREKLGDFAIMGTEEKSIFHLRRLSANMPCIVCKRTHDNENSFIVIDNFGNVRYYCFRNYYNGDNTGFIIGTIEVEHVPFKYINDMLTEYEMVGINHADEEKIDKRDEIPAINEGVKIDKLNWNLDKKNYNRETSKFSAR